MVEQDAQERMNLRTVLKCKLIGINDDRLAEIKISGIAQAYSGEKSLNYDTTKKITMNVSYDTWVKQVMNFDVFKPENIATPEEIMEELFDG